MTKVIPVWIDRLALVALFVVGMVGSIYGWNIVLKYMQLPPVVWHGVTVDTPVIRIGDTLKLTYTVEVRHQCPSEVRAFLRNEDTGAVLRRWVTQGGYTKAADGIRDIHVEIEISEKDQTGQFPDLVPGRYIYESTAIRFCPGPINMVVDNAVPSARFTIAPRN